MVGGTCRAKEEPVEIAILGVQLEGESPTVPHAVGRPFLPGNGREASEQGGLFILRIEEGGIGVPRDEFGVGHFELSVRTGAFRVDNPRRS